MRFLLLMVLAASALVLPSCHQAPASPVPTEVLDPPFTSFALRNDDDLDSLGRGASPTAAEQALLRGTLAYADSGERYAHITPKVTVLGRMHVGARTAYLLLRDLRAPGGPGSQAEVVLVVPSTTGSPVEQLVLGRYVLVKWHKEICSMEWNAPSLRARCEGQWVGLVDSLGNAHIEKRRTWKELRLTDTLVVIRQDTLRADGGLAD